MPCFHPLQAVTAPNLLTSNGKRVLLFKHGFESLFKAGFDFSKLPESLGHIQLPCGRCIGCRLEQSRQWAIRIMHEASLYDDNCFITLTFDNEHLPLDGSLDVRYFQLFMKSLRKKFGSGIRFFHCGEYGETYARPHYHACIFNFDFPDKQLFSHNSRTGFRLFDSAALRALWPYGFSTIGSLTFESAAYVARYCTKKICGHAAVDHYKGRKPEYTTMSRRPGIGKPWLDKFMFDVFPSDSVICKGIPCKPPRFYDKQFELEYPEDMELIRMDRAEKALLRVSDNTFDRLLVRETVKKAKLKSLPRPLDLGI